MYGREVAPLNLSGKPPRVYRERRLGSLVAVASVVGCALGHPHALTPAEQARWSRDSAQYVLDSAKWVHDAFVRDSISRTVNTDSLYHLYREMLTAPNPVPIMLLVNCERGRLTWLYGSPAIAAMTRMGDTLWHKDERDAANFMWDKLRNMTAAELVQQGTNPVKCGWRGLPKMPEVYNGTNVDVIPPRPRPPKRP